MIIICSPDILSLTPLLMLTAKIHYQCRGGRTRVHEWFMTVGYSPSDQPRMCRWEWWLDGHPSQAGTNTAVTLVVSASQISASARTSALQLWQTLSVKNNTRVLLSADCFSGLLYLLKLPTSPQAYNKCFRNEQQFRHLIVPNQFI